MATEETGLALEMLAKCLHVECRIIQHCPALLVSASDEEARNAVVAIGVDSIRHADAVAHMIRSLGGKIPFPFLEVVPATLPQNLFQRQLEHARLVHLFHAQAALLVPTEYRQSLRRIAAEERAHVARLEKVLEGL